MSLGSKSEELDIGLRFLFFFFKKSYLCIYLWLGWIFVAAYQLSLVAVHGFLIAVASLVVELGL